MSEQLDLLAEIGSDLVPRSVHTCGRCGQPPGQPARVHWTGVSRRVLMVDACAGGCRHYWQEFQRLVDGQWVAEY